MFLALMIAFGLGLYAASNHNRRGDWAVLAFTQIGVTLPNFWLGLLLILVFSVGLGWFASGGFPGWEAGFWTALRALVLPAVALAITQAAILCRVIRGSLLEVLGEDFMRTARAKGLSERQALLRHALRNAMIPVVTIIALQFAQVITGTIVIENVFSLPGLGQLVFQAINQRDVVVVRNVVLFLAATVISISFIVDVAYVLIDPRLRRRV
jgi:peptide/nickel transport system permease protein